MTPQRCWVLPLLCLGLALEILVTNSNVALFLWLNQISHALPAWVWSHLTTMGDAALAPLCLLPWWRRRPDLLWAGLLAALLAFLFSHGLKHWFDAPRPPAVLTVSVIGPRLLHSSFPSGHTTAIFTVIGLFVLGFPLRTRWLVALVLLAGAVGYSRIALGVHWPLDVLVGAAGGWICAMLGILMAHRWPQGQDRGRGIALLILLALAFYDLWRGPNGMPGIQPFQKGITMVCLLTAIWPLFNMRPKQP